MTSQFQPVQARSPRGRVFRIEARVGAADGEASNLPGVLRLLNDALAASMVCVLRYRQHHFLARSARAYAAAWEFLDQSNEAQGHADLIAERIVQLGGTPDFSFANLSRLDGQTHAETANVRAMVKEDLQAGHLAIDDYQQFIEFLRDEYPTTRRVLEAILAVKQEHSVQLTNLLQSVPAKPAYANQ
mgnify:CR=1 FL=1